MLAARFLCSFWSHRHTCSTRAPRVRLSRCARVQYEVPGYWSLDRLIAGFVPPLFVFITASQIPISCRRRRSPGSSAPAAHTDSAANSLRERKGRRGAAFSLPKQKQHRSLVSPASSVLLHQPCKWSNRFVPSREKMQLTRKGSVLFQQRGWKFLRQRLPFLGEIKETTLLAGLPRMKGGY